MPTELMPERCYYCGTALEPTFTVFAANPRAKTRDHMVPRSRVSGLLDNKVSACLWCNNLKGCRDVDEFRGFLNLVRSVAWDAAFAGERRGASNPVEWFAPLSGEWGLCRKRWRERIQTRFWHHYRLRVSEMKIRAELAAAPPVKASVE